MADVIVSLVHDTVGTHDTLGMHETVRTHDTALIRDAAARRDTVGTRDTVIRHETVVLLGAGGPHEAVSSYDPAAAPELLSIGADDAVEQSWQDRALCAQTDPEAFFPEKGGSTREAKRVCRSCEVRVECLEYALENDERFGIWGGLSERERRRLKREAV